MEVSRMIKTLILLLIAGLPAMAQTEDRALQQAKATYQEVNLHIASYKVTEVYMEGISTEGATVEGYYAGDTLRLMVQEVMGETGKYRLEVYYKADKPVFYYERSYAYQRPITHPAFDKYEPKISEVRGYFDNGKMIRWIDEKSHIFLKRDNAFVKTEQTFLKTAVDLREILKAGHFDPPVNK